MNIESGNYVVEPTASSLGWEAYRKVLGGHKGTIAIKSGNISIDASGVSGEFVIDMTKISEGTLPDEEKKKFLGHLLTDDFFSVEKFPTANLKIKEISDTNQVTADLTIKGATNEIKFPAIFTVSDGLLKVEANFKIDRTLWDIRFGSGKFFENLGDNLIDDQVGMTLKIVASKK